MRPMAGRISLSGKKYGGTHSSYTKMAGDLVRELVQYPEVKKISAGIIKTNLPNLRGNKRIKIVDEGACLLLRIRGNISMQEVRVYGISMETGIAILGDYAQVHNIQLRW